MEEKKMYKPLVSLQKGARHIGISVETLRKKIQQGLVESHKLFGKRLISEDEIIRLIEESRIPARGEKRPRVESVTAPTRGRGSR